MSNYNQTNSGEHLLHVFKKFKPEIECDFDTFKSLVSKLGDIDLTIDVLIRKAKAGPDAELTYKGVKYDSKSQLFHELDEPCDYTYVSFCRALRESGSADLAIELKKARAKRIEILSTYNGEVFSNMLELYTSIRDTIDVCYDTFCREVTAAGSAQVYIDRRLKELDAAPMYQGVRYLSVAEAHKVIQASCSCSIAVLRDRYKKCGSLDEAVKQIQEEQQQAASLVVEGKVYDSYKDVFKAYEHRLNYKYDSFLYRVKQFETLDEAIAVLVKEFEERKTYSYQGKVYDNLRAVHRELSKTYDITYKYLLNLVNQDLSVEEAIAHRQKELDAYITFEGKSYPSYRNLHAAIKDRVGVTADVFSKKARDLGSAEKAVEHYENRLANLPGEHVVDGQKFETMVDVFNAYQHELPVCFSAFQTRAARLGGADKAIAAYREEKALKDELYVYQGKRYKTLKEIYKLVEHLIGVKYYYFCQVVKETNHVERAIELLIEKNKQKETDRPTYNGVIYQSLKDIYEKFSDRIDCGLEYFKKCVSDKGGVEQAIEYLSQRKEKLASAVIVYEGRKYANLSQFYEAHQDKFDCNLGSFIRRFKRLGDVSKCFKKIEQSYEYDGQHFVNAGALFDFLSSHDLVKCCRALFLRKLKDGCSVEEAMSNNSARLKPCKAFDVEYESLKACYDANSHQENVVSLATFRKRVNAGEPVEQALFKKEEPEKLECNVYEFDGVVYECFDQAIEAVGALLMASPYVIAKRMRKNQMSFQDAVEKDHIDEGRAFGEVSTVEGRIYASLKDMALAYKLPLKRIKERYAEGCRDEELIKPKETFEYKAKVAEQRAEAQRQAEERRAKQIEAAQLRGCTVEGKFYPTKKAVAEAYNVSVDDIYAATSRGWTIEQALGLDEAPERRNPAKKIPFRGDEYFMVELAAASGLTSRYLTKGLNSGLSIEEAIGDATVDEQKLLELKRTRKRGGPRHDEVDLVVDGRTFGTRKAIADHYGFVYPTFLDAMRKLKNAELAVKEMQAKQAQEESSIVVNGKSFTSLFKACKHFKKRLQTIKAKIERGATIQEAFDDDTSNEGEEAA